MGIRTCNKIGNPPIDLYLGTAYDDVALVARNMDAILAVINNIEYLSTYLGASDTPPTTRVDGSPLENGDYFYNSSINALVYYDLAEELWYEVDPSEVYAARDAAIAAKDDAEAQANNAAQSATDAEQAVDDAEQILSNIDALTAQQTTQELINSSLTYSVDTVLETSGFATAGDGGGAKWLQNGVTSQTPSQTPSQLGNALLNDANGNQWRLITLGATSVAEVCLSALGATIDGVTDDYLIWVAAINFADGIGGAKIGFTGTTLVSQTINITENITIEGSSASRVTSTRGNSEILADHSDGPVIKITNENCTLKNLVIRGTSLRQFGDPGYNFGVLIEPDDTESGAVRGIRIDSVYVTDMPNHGFVTSGYVFLIVIEQCAVRDVFGHGFMFDGGEVTGRTNLARPGGIQLIMPKTFAIAGHAVVGGTGGGSPLSYGMYRFEMTNSEFARGGVDLDPSLKLSDSSCYLKGENITTSCCAFDGDDNLGVPTYRAMTLNGRSHRHSQNRYIKTTGMAHIEQNGSFNSTDIIFEGAVFSVASTNSPAITADAGVDSVTLKVSDTSQISSEFDSNVNNPVVEVANSVSRDTQALTVRKLNTSSVSLDAVNITRADSETGINITRTGVGSVTGRIDTNGGALNVGTTSESDLNLKANGVEKIKVTSTTGDTGGSNSAGPGSQYVELEIAGVRYKLLHDGAI